jgi:peptidoglycan hydrolase CwlO-like protein
MVVKDTTLADNDKKLGDLDKELQRLKEEYIKDKYGIVKDFEDKVNSLTSANKALTEQLSTTKNSSIILNSLEPSFKVKEEEFKTEVKKKQLELNEVKGLLSKAMEDIEKLKSEVSALLLKSKSLEGDVKKK